MTTILLKLLPYTISGILVGIGAIYLYLKQRGKYKKQLNEKQETIVSLRGQILQMVELEAEQSEVQEQNKRINTKIIDNSVDIDESYNDKLRDFPTRS